MSKFIFLFPLWAILLGLIAFIYPNHFISLKPYIFPLLGLVMLGMGITLNISDFKSIAQRPLCILAGLAGQYLLMPIIAWLLSLAFALPTDLMIGLILVGTCPGGTASNVVCYLAKGDVALSITLTTTSTLMAILATPFLMWVYAGQLIEVPALNMLLDILKIIIIPVALGVTINYFFAHRINLIKQVFPVISALSIIVIIAIIVALNKNQINIIGLTTALAVILHNTLGLAGGYTIARVLGYNSKIAKTLAIEVGMQNSGLGVALAIKYFNVAAALPGAIFSIWHNIAGSLLAVYWSHQDSNSKAGEMH